MAKSSIEWCTDTWNPLRGCSRVSEGCRNCYAEKVAFRFRGSGLPYEGLTTDKGRWNGSIMLVPEKLSEPLRWTRPRRVFVNSMSDLFHEGVPDEYIAAVFGVMAASPKHTFQVLTKRPERAAKWFEYVQRRQLAGKSLFPLDTDQWRIWQMLFKEARTAGVRRWREHHGGPWPLPNVWLGVSIEDQATADERIPLLLDCPAAVRFVSYEPAIGPVDLWPRDQDRYGVNWVIVGGESGPGARPFSVAYARSVISQCRAAGVACFVKQLGSRPYTYPFGRVRQSPRHMVAHGEYDPDPDWWRLTDKKGGDMAEWPEDLRVREFPS